MSRVLLTGASGFLGTQIARRLLNSGHELIAVVRGGEPRLRRAWWDFADLRNAEVEAVDADITAPFVAPACTHVIHAAADIRFGASAAVNVAGTANVLAAARAMPNLERFAHVSTAYLQGRNAYERTKAESERLVRESGLPWTILRPGMIVGDSRTGEIKTFNTVYYFLRLYLTGRLRLIPVSRSFRIGIVPVDYVADACARLAFRAETVGRAFHLTCPESMQPTAGEMFDAVRECVPGGTPRALFVPLRLHRFAALAPYLSPHAPADRTETDSLLGPYTIGWRGYLPRLVDYAVSKSFLHRTGRTVHEQALARLAGRSLPVRCFDISGGRIVPRGGESLGRDILAAAGALRAMGVEPGTRVSLIGPNSTRYLALDLAIGLAGAVSVPLYPGAPEAEIESLMAASGAKLLLRVPSEVEWPAFLAGAAAGGCAAPSLGDIATVRFTSGTGGAPKPVEFRHDQLRWMAETVPSLVPWRDRTRPIRVLCCLPLNHVVGGILGLYSAFYAPAPVDIYFLDDFHCLASALRRVRPTFFFCVPRFYEKLRDAARRLPVGWLVRRRAGLDRCSLLVAGSAPVSRDLVDELARAGIDVHEAYGLTEAPLVTINRPGRNRPGTAGEPLPETELRIAGDGEVFVRGPQVAASEAEWLATGDLGRIEDGRLVITGRKKDVIITSYGKTISPERIEAMLRAVPGVVEAMLVGDGRPYCTALIWARPSPAGRPLDGAIAAVNAQLAEPERVRRWAVAGDAPEPGADLTSNLKLKRAAVARRYYVLIESLYGAAAPLGRL